MKNKKNIIVTGTVLAVLLGGALVGKIYFDKQKENTYMTAVYLEDEQGNNLFVETETEMPFYGTIPEELYDENGKKISEEELEFADVVKIWGNGVIAESYPAQYHGITKIQITEKNNKEYAEKYASYLEQFIIQLDEKELPYLDISYKQPDALVTAAVDTVAHYVWEYGGEDGKEFREEGSDTSVLKLPELAEIKVAGDTQAELLFSTEPEKIEVLRWEESYKMEEDSTESTPEGENVETEISEEGNMSVTIQPGYIYMVKAFWENGEAEYGFSVTEMPKIE